MRTLLDLSRNTKLSSDAIRLLVYMREFPKTQDYEGPEYRFNDDQIQIDLIMTKQELEDANNELVLYGFVTENF